MGGLPPTNKIRGLAIRIDWNHSLTGSASVLPSAMSGEGSADTQDKRRRREKYSRDLHVQKQFPARWLFSLVVIQCQFGCAMLRAAAMKRGVSPPRSPAGEDDWRNSGRRANARRPRTSGRRRRVQVSPGPDAGGEAGDAPSAASRACHRAGSCARIDSGTVRSIARLIASAM